MKIEDAEKVAIQTKRWHGVLRTAFETLNSSRDPSPVRGLSEVVLPPFTIISPRRRDPNNNNNNNTLLVYTSLTSDKSNILNVMPLQTRRKSKLNNSV